MRKNALHLAMALLLLVSASSAWGAVGSEIDESDRELILEHAYRNLTRFAAVGGESITFRIDSLRTVEAGDFGRQRWSRLMSMPGGDMIDMTREVREYEGALEAVIYRPKWNLDAPPYLESDEGRTLRNLTVIEVLQAVAAERPQAARATAITSYRVRVDFQGRSRTYRAAVLWLPPSPGRDATLFFQDHITQGLEEAVREPPTRPRPRPAFLPNKTLSCYAGSATKNYYKEIHGYDGHWNQNTSHYALADVGFTCTCESDCSATCDATFYRQECDDSATFTVDSCHRMATAVRVAATGSQDGSTTAPAPCAAGLGCVKRSCYYCTCGLAVEVEIAAGTVTFPNSGAPDWEGNLDFPSYQCAACLRTGDGGGGGDEDRGPFDIDPGGGGGSGGGGFGCCWWHTSCYVDGNGVYTCSPSYCGQWGCG